MAAESRNLRQSWPDTDCADTVGNCGNGYKMTLVQCTLHFLGFQMGIVRVPTNLKSTRQVTVVKAPPELLKFPLTEEIKS